jgi:hypothetical protein
MIRIVRLRHNAPPVGVSGLGKYVCTLERKASHVPKSTIAAGIISNPEQNRPARGKYPQLFFVWNAVLQNKASKMAISGL